MHIPFDKEILLLEIYPKIYLKICMYVYACVNTHIQSCLLCHRNGKKKKMERHWLNKLHRPIQ